MDDEIFFLHRPKWKGTDQFTINLDFFKMPKTEVEEPVMNIETKAHNVDAYLKDNFLHPRPVELLLTYSFAYFMQLVDCAVFWSPASRLAVGSLIFDQPLVAQGAEDVTFHIYLITDKLLDERTDKIKVIRLSNNAQFYINIIGDRYKVNDVNRPAEDAVKRMAERGLKLEDQVFALYAFVRDVASQGFGMNFNELSRDNVITNDGHRVLLSAEAVIKNSAVKALNNFEGRIETYRGLPTDDEVRNASHSGVRGDE